MLRLSRKGIFLGNFYFVRIIPNLLIVPANGPVDFRSGHSLSAGRSWILLGAWAPAGSPVTSLSRRSRVPSAPINREANQPKVLQHTFSNFAKCVTIFFIFWQAAVRSFTLYFSGIIMVDQYFFQIRTPF